MGGALVGSWAAAHGDAGACQRRERRVDAGGGGCEEGRAPREPAENGEDDPAPGEEGRDGVRSFRRRRRKGRWRGRWGEVSEVGHARGSE
jgi:hypothetical protein